MIKIIVVKIGSSLLTNEKGQLDSVNLKNLVEQISTLQKHFKIENSDEYRFIIVTSGSITCGSETLELTPKTIPEKQAAASVGQHLLMQEYGRCFKEKGLNVGQILLTRDGLENPEREINIINTITTLLSQGVIPIINENDSVATEEIKFGDNDELSSKVAVLLQANKLILLTDTDGLYNKNPQNDSTAKLLGSVEIITAEILAMAEGPKSEKSRGGMKTKLLAAQLATTNGIETVIANGRKHKIIENIFNGGEFGTIFLAKTKEG
jgi:glutamate 5-kinase